MPNGHFHRRVGIATGAVVAAYRYRSLSATIAGGIGGRIGAAVPDWLEPATTPHHRDVVHSWTMVTVVATSAPEIVRRAERYAGHAQHAEQHHQ